MAFHNWYPDIHIAIFRLTPCLFLRPQEFWEPNLTPPADRLIDDGGESIRHLDRIEVDELSFGPSIENTICIIIVADIVCLDGLSRTPLQTGIVKALRVILSEGSFSGVNVASMTFRSALPPNPMISRTFPATYLTTLGSDMIPLPFSPGRPWLGPTMLTLMTTLSPLLIISERPRGPSTWAMASSTRRGISSSGRLSGHA